MSRSSYIVEGKIEASAYRRLPEEARRPERLLELNQALIENARLQGHAQRNGQDLSDLDLLAELQHFGAATCLIDFTSNALVALWFACQQSAGGNKENGKVVVLRSDGLEPLKRVDYELSQQNLDDLFKPDATGRHPLYRWQPKFQNTRIISQQSVFVFGRASIEELTGECEIEASCKPDLLTALEEVSGITGASLFSDFDGFAWLHAHDKPYIEPTAKAYRLRGIDAVQKGNLERAIPYFTQAITLNRKNAAGNQEKADAYFQRAWAYRREGAYDKAIKDCDKAIEYYEKAIEEDSMLANKLNPEVAKVYNIRGIAYADKCKFKKAIKAYNHAIKLNPTLAKAYTNRGNAYADKRKFKKAIKDYNHAIKLQPHYLHVYCNRGEAWLHLKEWEQAREDLTKARAGGVDIIASFQADYKSVEEFRKKNDIDDLPDDIAEMLRQS